MKLSIAPTSVRGRVAQGGLAGAALIAFAYLEDAMAFAASIWTSLADLALPLFAAVAAAGVLMLGLFISRTAQRSQSLPAKAEVTPGAQAATRFKERRLINLQTGLADRRALERDVRVRPDSWGTAVILLDISGYDRIEGDRDGEAASRLLAAICARLGAHVKVIGRLFHLGGPQFVIIVDGQPSSNKVVNICHFLLALMREPFELSGGRFTLVPYLGVTVISRQDRRIIQTAARAERALDEVRRAGTSHMAYASVTPDQERAVEAQARS
ncbi:GGDEF domain-containing protein, diguanylate cyclase (c-di-GMP synthetase) or its enzymatically inactive variants [Xaviernesmea oryzae]|nr:GGDEF domain-containing protein, diguanylate cyclase (c-di-GMP synthetase) or its enzymatically inactive variants [Xaviernesmea oryzae]